MENLKEKFEDACAELEYDIWRLKKMFNEIQDECPNEYKTYEKDVCRVKDLCDGLNIYLSNLDFSFYEKGERYE